MPKQIAALLIAAAEAVSAEKSGTWMRLMPSGTFSARDGRGPFTSGDQASMEAIVARTKAHLGATEMMVDYDHQVLSTGKDGGATAKAAGWIKDYQVRPDGIYGLVDWTEAAAAAIEAKEYRYLSPLFGTDKQGRVVRFANIALLNMPAIDLEAIAAGAKLNLSKGPTMDPILEALGLAEGATEADALSAISALQSGLSAIALAAGLDKEADMQVVAAAVKTAKASATPDPAKYVPIEQVTALQNDLTALKASLNGDKAEAAVAAAIESGKLAPALKDWGLELAKADLAKFEAFAAASPTLTGTQLGNARKPETETTTDLDDADLQVMSQMGLSRDDMIAAKKGLSE